MSEWLELQVTSPEGTEEIVAELLHDAGSEGTVLADTLDAERSRDVRQGYTVVSGFFAREQDIDAVVASVEQRLGGLFARLGLEPPVIRRRAIHPEDWAESWKKYYHVTRVSPHLVIVPEWEDYVPMPGETVITIDPGMAFGSGTHDTTQFALRAMCRILLADKPASMADAGTGSGILAITALKLGVPLVVGIDVQPQACRQAAQNARLNNVDRRLELWTGDVANYAFAEPFPLVTANLTPDPLIQLCDTFGQMTAASGYLVASGITRPREKDVQAALAGSGFAVVDRETTPDSKWLCLVLRREESR